MTIPTIKTKLTELIKHINRHLISKPRRSMSCDKNLINTWGFCKRHDRNAIHPEDEYDFRSSVFKCVDILGEYVLLKNPEYSFRVKCENYATFPDPPKFDFDEQVRPKNKSDVIGVIFQMIWHYKRGEMMYFIKINGKKKSKRYWADDLISVSDGIEPTMPRETSE